ncbi:MAG: hypothetical protein QF878_08150, partial [SAR202 cluster bacterium]|nr:hypothetical protein [SAR202 cluster bacterium]
MSTKLARRFWFTAFAVLILAIPFVASADVTIDPNVNDLTLNEGDILNETLTVTVPPGTTASKADVYILADTTGSMGSIITAVKTGASTVVDGLIASLPSVDLAFGAGDYKDFPYDAYAFDHQVSIASGNAVATKAAINGWSASGGSDGSEGQFFALDQLAGDTDPAGGSIGWRPDAERIIVWFGDAPAHDSVCSAISGLSYNITEGSVTGKLTGAGISVLAISTATGYPNMLDDDPTSSAYNYSPYCAIGGTAGQATRIANATNGAHVSGIVPSTIVSTITGLVTSAVTTINNLSLSPTGSSAPFLTSVAPAGGFGPLDGSVSHTLSFDVTFTGVVPCSDVAQVFTGTIDVVADGSVVAQKTVTITVPPCDDPPPPEPEDEGFMTGGGNITVGKGKKAARYTHGFEIRCDG